MIKKIMLFKNIFKLNLTIMIFKVQGFKAHLRSLKAISNVYSKKDFSFVRKLIIYFSLMIKTSAVLLLLLSDFSIIFYH